MEENKRKEDLIREISSKGFDTIQTNYIVKGVLNGLQEMKDLDPHVASDIVKDLYRLFKSNYDRSFNEDLDDKNKEIRNRMVELLNEDYTLEASMHLAEADFLGFTELDALDRTISSVDVKFLFDKFIFLRNTAIEKPDKYDESDAKELSADLVEYYLGYKSNETLEFIINNYLETGIYYQIDSKFSSTEIKEITNLFNKYYTDDSISRKIINRMLVEGVPFSLINNFKHSEGYLNQLRDDFKNKKDYSIYTSKTEPDFTMEKIRLLINIRNNYNLEDLDSETIEEIKSLNTNDLDGLCQLRRNETEEFDIKDILKEHKTGAKISQNFRSIQTVLNIKNNFPEVYDLIKDSEYSFNITNLYNELVNHKEDYKEKLKFYEGFTDNPRNLMFILKNPQSEKIKDVLLSTNDEYKREYACEVLAKDPESDIVEFIKLLSDCNVRFLKFFHNDFKNLFSHPQKEEILNLIRSEIEYNPNFGTEDIQCIIDGVENGIDASLYTASEDTYAYSEEEKHFMYSLLCFNKRHPEEEIDLIELGLIDDYETHSFDFDEFNLEPFTYLLDDDFNISKIFEIDSNINYLIMDDEEYKTLLNNKDNIEKLLEYSKILPTDNDEITTTFLNLLLKGKAIYSKEQIVEKSVPSFKEVAKMARYDDFSAHVIDDILSEDNVNEVLNVLREYQKTQEPFFKEIYKIRIDNNMFKTINQPLYEDLSEEMVKTILEDIPNRVDIEEYLSINGSDELKLAVRELILKDDSKYFSKGVHDFIDEIKKDPENANIETIKLAARESSSHFKYFKPQYSVEQIKLYSNYLGKTTIYDWSIYNKLNKVDHIIARSLEKEFENLDRNDTIENQKEFLKEAEIKALKEAATYIEEKENSNIDLKLEVLDKIKKLETQNLSKDEELDR